MGREESHGVAELLEGPPPVVCRAARFQQDRRGRPIGEERQEPCAAQPMLFVHPTGMVRHGDLEDGLCDVNGDGRMLHLDSSFAMASGAASSLPR